METKGGVNVGMFDRLFKKGKSREDQETETDFPSGKADKIVYAPPHEQITTAEQARVIYRKADALYKKGDFSGAIVLYDRLLKALPGLINPYEVRQARAMAYCKTGRFAEAEQELKQLLNVLESHGATIASSQVMYWYLVARYQGDTKKAMDDFIKL